VILLIALICHWYQTLWILASESQSVLITLCILTTAPRSIILVNVVDGCIQVSLPEQGIHFYSPDFIGLLLTSYHFLNFGKWELTLWIFTALLRSITIIHVFGDVTQDIHHQMEGLNQVPHLVYLVFESIFLDSALQLLVALCLM
jgi:hypothetical protein